ncbi:hypothetical protein KUTeg_001420 [Tegillarca granosa]|uniref:Tyr recombinase domain-containing protein n=1 Tax=Tegillarca granosa TaxID=220873 RepID=A0ABQ9FRD9_TEGGR|nr:hypothetical protein KUTeg_001420 [Tegillarca granosa]
MYLSYLEIQVQSLAAMVNHSLLNNSLISKFMKGLFLTKPPVPRYTETWNVGFSLKYLTSVFSFSRLSLCDLTIKLVCLLALTKAQRVQTNKLNCVFHTLNYYIIKTRDLWKSQNVLVSFKTGKMVSTSTFARLICKEMSEAGIDTNKFKAHSVRSAASSAAFRAGVSLRDILQTEKWSSAQTFHTFYNRHIGDNTSTRSFLDTLGIIPVQDLFWIQFSICDLLMFGGSWTLIHSGSRLVFCDIS